MIDITGISKTPYARSCYLRRCIEQEITNELASIQQGRADERSPQAVGTYAELLRMVLVPETTFSSRPKVEARRIK